MEKIVNRHLDLTNIGHGVIKYNYVSNIVSFDAFFIETFGLPIKAMTGIKTDNKIVKKNSQLINLLKVIKRIRSDKKFTRVDYDTGVESKPLYLKRLVQLDEEYIFAYFVSPKLSDFAANIEINESVLSLLADSITTNFWWIDFSKEDTRLFSSSDVYGTGGAIIKHKDSKFMSYLTAAAEENAKFATLAEIAKSTMKETIKGNRDSCEFSHPIKVDDKILWIDTVARVASRDSSGRPLLVVGVDRVSTKEDVNLEKEVSRQIIDTGLNKSDIGLWTMTIKDGVKSFKYNEKLRELYNFGGKKRSSKDVRVYDNGFQLAKAHLLKLYPEYITFFDDDYKLFTKALDNEFDSYRSILPFINTKKSVTWVEFRAHVVERDKDGNVLSLTGAAVDITDLMESKIYENLFDKLKTKVNNANKQAIDMTELLIWSIDYVEHPKGDLFYGNEKYIQKLGLTKDPNGLLSISDYYDTINDGDDYSLTRDELNSYTDEIRTGRRDGFTNIILKHKNKKTGDVLYGSHSSKVFKRSSSGKVESLSGYFMDVTNEINEKRRNDALNESISEVRKFNKLAVQAGKLMVFNINYLYENRGKEIYANNYFVEALELSTIDNHFSYEEYLNTVCDDEEGRRLFAEVDPLYMNVLRGQSNSVSNELTKHKSVETGRIIYLQHNSHVQERSSDGKVVAIGGFLTDVTNEILNKKRVKYLAEMDTLTDVYNRNSFEETISDIDYSEYSIVLFDVDGLKLANDIFGHSMGDDILRKFAAFLKSAFPEDKVYRIGGDEFCVLTLITEEEKLTNICDWIKFKMESMASESNYKTGVSIGFETVTDGDFSKSFTSAENQMYRKKLSSRSSRKSNMLETLLVTLSEKTEETNEHCERLAHAAKEVSKKLGHSRAAELYDISLAAKLHDIGKITIPLEILNKKGKLTEDEYTIVKKHSDAGYKIVFNLMSSDDIAGGVLYHHERYDGAGYPYGLSGKEIPLYARIICVCDAFDAMISKRPYSESMSVSDAMEELIRCKGSQFDPEIVDVYIELLEEEVLLDK